MRRAAVRLSQARLRLDMMHRGLRSIERGGARGPEAKYGKDSYHQRRALKLCARQLHPVISSQPLDPEPRVPPRQRTSYLQPMPQIGLIAAVTNSYLNGNRQSLWLQ